MNTLNSGVPVRIQNGVEKYKCPSAHFELPVKVAYFAAVTDCVKRYLQFNGKELSVKFALFMCYVGETLYKYPERTRHFSQIYGCSKFKDT